LSEQRLEKTKTWFQKAIVLDPDCGDAYVQHYKFLAQHGTDEEREELGNKMVVDGPRHGEVWQSVRKDVKNVRMSGEELLRLAAARAE
jgi:pre-mRNA-processing factor 6